MPAELTPYVPAMFLSLLVAALMATAFPLLYSLGPWYKDALGRALMWKALSFALIIDMTLWFTIYQPSDLRIMAVVHIISFSFVAIATGYLTWMLWKHNFIRPQRENTMRTRSEYQAEIRKSDPLLADNIYNFVRRLVEYILPALGALYFTLSEIWGLPYPAEVVGTIAAFTTFLGVVVHISRKSYNKSGAKYDGELVVDTLDPERDTFSIDLGDDLENLPQKDELILKVRNVE